MEAPRRTAILSSGFHVWTTAASICGERYTDEGEHTDTQVKIWNALTGDLVADQTIGYGEINVQITGLSLTRNAIYRAQIRYANAAGWGGWSKNAYAKISSQMEFEAIAVPGEPAIGGQSPHDPEFAIEIERHRPMMQWQLETAHVKRRPVNTNHRLSVMMRWRLEPKDADEQHAFLQARIAAVEAFTTADPVLGAMIWFPRRGSIERAYPSPGIVQITIDADEVRGS